MKPMIDYLLDEVIHLSESEPIPKDDGEAIRYMAKWDHGEYAQPPQPFSSLYGLDGRTVTQGEYVMHRSGVGDATLYRKGPICHPYELRQIDAWHDDIGGWSWNESWRLRDVHVGEGAEEDFLLELVAPSTSRHTVGNDGNGMFELLEAESGRPLYALLPNNE